MSFEIRPDARLLVVRTSALGDIVHCLPALDALRAGFPRATIGWVVERSFLPLLEGHTAIDELIPVGLRPWRHRPFATSTRRELTDFVRQLRHFRADVVVDLMSTHKSGVIGRLAGARHRVGARRADRKERSSALWSNRRVPVSAPHAVDRALQLISGLDLGVGPPADLGGRFLRPEDSTAPAGVEAGKYLVIQAGASWGNKRYPTERWGRVARSLRDRSGWPVLAIFGPGEDGLAAEVVAHSDGAAVAHADGGLGGLVATLRHAAAVVGSDTGPIHLAHALGTPVVCLMGPTDPDRHGPYGDPDAVIARPFECRGCYRRYDETKICLLDIRPEEIVDRTVSRIEATAERSAN